MIADKNFNLITLVTKKKKNVFITISRHIQNPGIIRTVYSDIIRDIHIHSGIFRNIQP